MAEGVTFTRESAQRIGDVVRKVEAETKMPPWRRNKYTSGEVARMFKVSFAPEDGDAAFRYLPGIWTRSNRLGATPISTYPVPGYDPVEEGVIAGVGSEKVWIYACLLNSDAGAPCLDMDSLYDFRFDSDFWIDTAAGIAMVIKSVPLQDIDLDLPADPFDQWKLIAQLIYQDGIPQKVVQLHLGPIEDNNPVHGPGASLGAYLQDENVYTDFTKTVELSLKTSAGGYKRRDQEGIFDAKVMGETPDLGDWYAYLGPSSTGNWTQDPSLVPYDTEVALDNESSETWAFYKKLLFTVDGDVDEDGQTVLGLKIFHDFGNWEDDWVRPDGIDIGGFGVDIDEEYDRIASLNFVSSGGHIGELQLGNAWELLADSSLIAQYTGDMVVPYIDYVAGGKSEMNYGRLDTPNAVSWGNCGESLDVNSDQVFELRQFYSAVDGILSPTGPAEDWFDGGAQVLVRYYYGTHPVLRYVDLSGMEWNPGEIPWNPDWCEDVLDCPGLVFDHEDLGFANMDDCRSSAELNWDHDYRYWQQGGTYALYNYGQSIGYGTDTYSSSAPSLRIELYDCTLGVDSDVYLDWDNMWLQDSGTTRLDWGEATLIADDGSTVRYDWDTGIFYDDGEAPSLNHLLRTLDGDTSETVGWEVTSEIDSSDEVSGALVVAGGIGAAKYIAAGTGFKIGDGITGGNYWTDSLSLFTSEGGAYIDLGVTQSDSIYVSVPGTLSFQFGDLLLNGDEWEIARNADLTEEDEVLRKVP